MPRTARKKPRKEIPEPIPQSQTDSDEEPPKSPEIKQSASQNPENANPDPTDENCDDEGEELVIPEDPMTRFTLPENFFIRKEIQNLGVGKLGEPRLVISHITNENFKSYAGTVVLGPFHANFTSIIGPNGSGKSNVIDSLLFVFGFKASRIRLKNLASLIHFSDSVKSKPPTSATVTVHFKTIIDDVDNPGEKWTVVENSEFDIARTCFKDGSSVYRVDGKKKQMKDVKKRLRDEGIDLDHNRFLILQGEVEQISLMKPKAVNPNEEGMLEYLEDIIGTNRYKQPIEVLKEHADILSELRANKLKRVADIEQEVEELKEARNEANDYLRNLNGVKILDHKKSQKILQNLFIEFGPAENDYNTKLETLKKMESDQNEDKVGLKQCEKIIKGINKKWDKTSKAMTKVIKKVSNLSSFSVHHEFLTEHNAFFEYKIASKKIIDRNT